MMMKRYALGAVAALFLSCSAMAQEQALPAGSYTLDKSHASLTFSVSHVGFSSYTMSFDRFDAALTLDPAEPGNAKVTAMVDPLSLDLPSPPEGFLQEVITGTNWLNAKAYPRIAFTSSKVVMTGAKTADIEGELELLGVKKSVVLHATFNGGYTGHPMDPNARVGFSAHGKFNRSDFGMTYGIPEPGTTMGVGDEVQVTIEAEFSGPALKAEAKP